MINDKILLSYKNENARLIEFIKICKSRRKDVNLINKMMDETVSLINLEVKVMKALNIKIQHDHHIDHKNILSFISSARKKRQSKESSCIEIFNCIEQLYLNHDLKYGNKIFQQMSENLRRHPRTRS